MNERSSGGDANSVRKAICVNAPQEVAWRVFTERIGAWWPLARFKIGKVDAVDAVIEPRVGGRWYERGQDGSTCDWGSVLAWEPPSRLLLSWDINADWQYDPELKTELEIRFIAQGGRVTRVELEHRKLDRYGARRDAMREAEQAKAELDRELQAQSEAWLKSYDRARQLALETKDAADRASVEATAARDRNDRSNVLRRRAALKKSATRDAEVVTPPVKIKGDVPAYPAIAKAAGVEGTVTIAARVDRNGTVTGTSVVRSIPLLNQAALDAVKEWQFEPQRVGGKPVPTTVTVNVNFVRS